MDEDNMVWMEENKTRSQRSGSTNFHLCYLGQVTCPLRVFVFLSIKCWPWPFTDPQNRLVFSPLPETLSSICLQDSAISWLSSCLLLSVSFFFFFFWLFLFLLALNISVPQGSSLEPLLVSVYTHCLGDYTSFLKLQHNKLPQTKWLTRTHISSSEVQVWCGWVLCSSLKNWSQRVSCSEFSSRGSREEYASKLSQVVGRIQLHETVGLRPGSPASCQRGAAFSS